MLEALHLRNVRVPVDDGTTIGEARREARLPPCAGAGIVEHPDPRAVELDDPLARQRFLQRRLVHVPLHALERGTEPAQLFEERRGHEVPAVEDQVGALQQAQTLIRKRPRASREVRVRDDRDARQ